MSGTQIKSAAVLFAVLIGMSIASMAQSLPSEAPVTPERLIRPEPDNWLLPHRTYDGWQYSPLGEINKKNAGKLSLAFAMPLGVRADGGGNNQAVPLVDGGFMYLIDPTGTVFKIDVHGRRGRTVWTYDTGTPPPQQGASRGVSLSGEAVIVNTRDGRVIALRRDTGDPIWEKQVGLPHEGFTAPPTIVKDLVIVGQSFGDWGTSGYVAALDAKTGKERWRFYTVPGPGEPGHETWPADNDAWMTGGGSIWVANTYDPRTNSLFVGTSNPTPALDPEARAGDNLYTASTVVLDVDTGKLKWYHQYTPNDSMEHDENSPHLLFDVPIKGRVRHVLGHVSRTGYYFTLDRDSGEFLGAVPLQQHIDWTSGINSKTGQPIEYDPAKTLQNYRVDTRRGAAPAKYCGGGYIAGFWPSAYDPGRERVYHMLIETCFTVVPKPESGAGQERFGNMGLGGTMNATFASPTLAAIDAKSGRPTVRKNLGIISQSGVLATAGGVVFVGLGDGTLIACDSDTLQTLWSINVGTPFKAPPISYSIDGRQYVAIIGGGGPQTFGGATVPELADVRNSSTLFVFALDQARTAPLVGAFDQTIPRAASVARQESTSSADIALADRGKTLWAGRAGCANCHGWAGDGVAREPFPPGANLRRTSLDNLQMKQIVRCGRPGTAMPFFDKSAYTDARCYGTSAEALGTLAPHSGAWLRPNEIDAIVAYVSAQIKGRGKITRAECESYFAASAGCESVRESQP